MEPPDVISLRDMLPRLDSNFTRRNVAHTNEDNAHQANVRIVGLNEDKATGRHLSEVRLGEIGKRIIRISEVFGNIFLNSRSPAQYRSSRQCY